MFHGLFGVPLMRSDLLARKPHATAASSCHSFALEGFLYWEAELRCQKGIRKDTIFFRSPAYFCEAYQPWQNPFNYGMMLINVDEYWYIYIYTTYSLCSRASLKLGTPADSRKCQPRGLDVSTNPRYVLENVNIFWRADRTGLDIESHTFDTHKP